MCEREYKELSWGDIVCVLCTNNKMGGDRERECVCVYN